MILTIKVLMSVIVAIFFVICVGDTLGCYIIIF